MTLRTPLYGLATLTLLFAVGGEKLPAQSPFSKFSRQMQNQLNQMRNQGRHPNRIQTEFDVATSRPRPSGNIQFGPTVRRPLRRPTAPSNHFVKPFTFTPPRIQIPTNPNWGRTNPWKPNRPTQPQWKPRSQPQRQTPRQPTFVRSEPRRVYPNPAPTRAPAKRVSVKRNPVPPPAPKKVAKNPTFNLNTTAMPRSFANATAQFAQDQANQNVDQFEQFLETLQPGLSNDPQLRNELDKIRDKINSGQVVTDEDWQDVTGALQAWAGARNIDLSPGTNDKTGQRIRENFFNTQQSVEDATTISALSTGQTPGVELIVFNPNMPSGVIMEMPTGGIMTSNTSVLGPEWFDEAPSELILTDGTIADAAGLPAVDTPPYPESTITAAAVSSGTLLLMPAELDASLSYVLNDQNSYTMSPGERQHLPQRSRKWIIAFDRGGSYGKARYSLSEGTYRFKATERGWDVVKQHAITLTLDNSDSSFAFHYVLDNESYSLRPGQTRDHSSPYQLFVRFDQGEGEEARKTVTRSAALKTGVRSSDNRWDLFPVEDDSSDLLGMFQPSGSADESKPRNTTDYSKWLPKRLRAASPKDPFAG